MLKFVVRPRCTEAVSQTSTPHTSFLLQSPKRLIATITFGAALAVAPFLTPDTTTAQPIVAHFALLGTINNGDAGFSVPDQVTAGQQLLAAPTQAVSQVKVGVAVANLRSGPGTNHSRIAKLKRGVILKVIDSTATWYKIRTASGTEGWISADVVGTIKANAEAAPAAPAAAQAVTITDGAGSEFGRNIAQTALQYVGRAYRYGGAGPNSFDCSGLTQYVYGQFGVSLPHKASSQYGLGGQRIASMADLQPGDLVFFANTAGRGITHTAIYVGDGKMVTANTPRLGVQLSTITDRYWRAHWAGGLRIG